MTFPITFTSAHEGTGIALFELQTGNITGETDKCCLMQLALYLHNPPWRIQATISRQQCGNEPVMVVRQYPRFQATFSGTLVHQGHLHQIDKALDLSRRGCRVESPFPAFAGMKVDLLLYIPEYKAPILIQGAVVRWSGAHGIGIQFQSLASPHRERLDYTLQRLETTAAPLTSYR
jgi:hypothetical protein